MKFLRLTYPQAQALAYDPNELYTSVYDSMSAQFYIYSAPYTPAEQPNTFALSQTQLDGLTPINPTKPMFPRKP